jgi:hypothetical protein
MKIVFKNEDNSIGIITPSDEALNFSTIGNADIFR